MYDQMKAGLDINTWITLSDTCGRLETEIHIQIFSTDLIVQQLMKPFLRPVALWPPFSKCKEKEVNILSILISFLIADISKK